MNGCGQGLPCEDWGPGPAGGAVEDQDGRQRRKMGANSVRRRGAQELVQGRKIPRERWETYQLCLRSGHAVASRPGSHIYFESWLLSLTDLPRADSLSFRVCFLWPQGHWAAAAHLQRKTGHSWPQGCRLSRRKLLPWSLGAWKQWVSCWQEVCFRTESDTHTDGQTGCLSRDQSRERTALGSKEIG